MGNYFNPGIEGFVECIQSEIYIDKTALIEQTNAKIGTQQKYICVSRPRQFGKSMALKMLSAYYQCEISSKEIFEKYEIAKEKSFLKHLNGYDVVSINMQDFLSKTKSVDELIELLQRRVLYDMKKKYSFCSTMMKMHSVTRYIWHFISQMSFIQL